MKKSEVNLGIECSVTVCTVQFCCRKDASLLSRLTSKVSSDLRMLWFFVFKGVDNWFLANLQSRRGTHIWFCTILLISPGAEWNATGHTASRVAEMCGYIYSILWVKNVASEVEVDSYAGDIDCDWSLWSKANWIGMLLIDRAIRQSLWVRNSIE